MLSEVVILSEKRSRSSEVFSYWKIVQGYLKWSFYLNIGQGYFPISENYFLKCMKLKSDNKLKANLEYFLRPLLKFHYTFNLKKKKKN